MDFKRILRTPVVWVVLIFGIGVLWLSVADSSTFTRIDTSAAEKLINDGAVDSAKFVGEDQVQLTLKPGQKYSDGNNVKAADKVMAYYVTPRGESLVTAVKAHMPPKGYTDDPPQQNWLFSLLATIIPLILSLIHI